MRKPFVFLEFKNSRCLTFADVYALVDGFYELILSVNEVLAAELRRHEPVSMEDRFLRAGFFAQATENTAQHVDLVTGCIALFPVKVLFTLLSLLRSHGYGLCRA